MFNGQSLEIGPPCRRDYPSSNGEEPQPPFEDVSMPQLLSPGFQSTNRSRTSRESGESARAFKQISAQTALLNDEALLAEAEGIEGQGLNKWDAADEQDLQDAIESEQPIASARGFGLDIQGGLYAPVATFSDAELEENPSQPTGLWVAMMACRARFKVILEDPGSSPVGFYVEYFVIFLIISSVACAIVETVPELKADEFFVMMETLFTGIFSLEVLMRYWTSDSTRGYFSNYFNVIDIMSTLPGYGDLIMRPVVNTKKAERDEMQVKDLSHSIQTLRLAQLVKTIRLFRILRLAKVIRQSESIAVVIKSIWGSLRGLWVLVSFVLLSTVLAATVCFFFEAQAPGTKFTSIPASIWWSAATILAVGYGDIVPQTVPGKITAVMTMLVGTVLIAVCIAVITSSFTELYQKNLYIARMKALRTRIQRSGRLSRLPEFDPKQVAKRISIAKRESTSGGGSRIASKEVLIEGARSPGTRSPGTRSPGGSRSPGRQSPGRRSPARRSPRRSSGSSRLSRRSLSPGRRTSKASAASMDSNSGSDSDTSRAEMDIAECVNQLEEMTSTLLLGFESLLRGQAEERPREGKCAELSLEMLRKNSRLWFEHVRTFTEEICQAEVPHGHSRPSVQANPGNAPGRPSVLW